MDDRIPSLTYSELQAANLQLALDLKSARSALTAYHAWGLSLAERLEEIADAATEKAATGALAREVAALRQAALEAHVPVAPPPSCPVCGAPDCLPENWNDDVGMEADLSEPFGYYMAMAYVASILFGITVAGYLVYLAVMAVLGWALP